MNVSARYILASNVSDEQSADALMGDPLYVIICFCLAAFKILCLSLAFEILIIMCLCVGLFKFILEFIKLLECLYYCLSSDLGSFQPLFFQTFCLPLSSPSWTPMMCMLVHWLHLISLLVSLLFSFCSTDSIIFLSITKE